MSKETKERLKQIKIENYIWIIYIFLIILCFISNYYEKNYFLTNNQISKEKYRNILIFIFSTALLIYTYFLYDNYKDYKNLSIYDNQNKKDFTEYSLIGSILIFIAGAIFLYIAINDQDIQAELAFN
jgi:hypothetical protein